MSRFLRCRLFLLCCAVLAAVPLAAAEPDGFRQAKTRLQQRLHSRRTEDRLAAIRELSEFHNLESARLLAQVQLMDGADEVRQEAYAALLSFNADPELCEALLPVAKKAAAGKDPGEAVLLLAVLLNSDLSKVEQDALAILDGALAAQKSGPLLVTALADELGRHGRQSDLIVLQKLARSKLFEAEFGVRRAIVAAIANVQRKEAIAALIELLPKLQGEVFADAVNYLGIITGEPLAADVPGWASWWKENQDTFRYPISVVRSPVRKLNIEGSGSYYGLPIYARRMVFVMDTSGSMAGNRLVAAKRELVTAIMGLKEGHFFTVVVFNGRVFAWQRQLVPANSVSKQAAATFVNNQLAQAMTCSYDALETALTFDAEAIYFLTDGQPSSGKIVNPVEIVNVISKLNRAKRESIYTIGIGVGPEGNPFDVFLSALAEQNLGVYRRVDE